MKLKTAILAGLLALAAGSTASAQTVINITGATAFRAAANDAIIAILGGAGTVKYGWVGTTGVNGTNHAIFEGSIGGEPFIIRTSQNGSTAGIAAVVNQTALTYLDVAATAGDIVVGGVQLHASIGAATTAGDTTTAVARFSFSDVSQDISNTPTPALPGAPVGVVPFVFVANLGAPAGLTNMTDQLHDAQWSLGDLPLSMYTGNPADTKRVLNTGRSNGSGTRATILAETQYGPFTSVKQWGGPNTSANISGTEGTDSLGTGAGAVEWLQFLDNGGYSSNSFVRQNLARTSTSVDVGTDATGAPITGTQTNQDIVIVSYLTLSDAVAITDLNGPATGKGAVDLTYNGMPYSEDNVKNGRYSLWGYQQFYGSVDITDEEQDFFDAFTAAIPAELDPLSTGIPIPDMNVTRNGGDGGPITPN
jgi:hypothetical protein